MINTPTHRHTRRHTLTPLHPHTHPHAVTPLHPHTHPHAVTPSHTPSQVEELFLDNVKASSLSGLSEAYSKLHTLSVVNSGLTSLDGLPRLDALHRVCVCVCVCVCWWVDGSSLVLRNVVMYFGSVGGNHFATLGTIYGLGLPHLLRSFLSCIFAPN